MKKSDKPIRRTRLYDTELPSSGNTNQQHTPDSTSYQDGCTGIEREFVKYWLAGYSRERAAIMAGYSPTSAYAKAWSLIKDPRILKYKAGLEAESLRRMNLDIDHFMRLRYLAATTPLTEIGEYFTPPCEHCWGVNNELQRTFHKMEEDFRNYQLDSSRRKSPFDPRGGDGYHHRTPINPDCPNCLGKGDELNKIFILKDWEDLTPAGKALLSGVKVRKNGTVEVTTDKNAASSDISNMIRTLIDPNRIEDDRRVFSLRSAVNQASGQLRITRVERIVVDPMPIATAEYEEA